jgi:molybdenum cofactor synthesis domain-containing protein
MNVAIVTVSTRAAAGVYEDRSGDRLVALAVDAGHTVVRREVVPDGEAQLTELLQALCADPGIALVVTTGGTGLTPTDRTPEATEAVCERLVPGIGEAIRSASLPTVPHAMLSRGIAGVLHHTLIVNLPGSPGGATDGWAVIATVAEHAISQIRGGDHPAPQPTPS